MRFLKLSAKQVALWTRPTVAAILAVFMTMAPAMAQDQGPTTTVNTPPPDAQKTVTTASSPTPKYSLGLSKHDFTHGPRSFPNLIIPYYPIFIEQPDLTNSPTLESLIHDGKLELSLADAIELSLQNNLDINVARYNPWLAETDVLRALGGGGIRGSGSTISTTNSTGSSTLGLSTATAGSGQSNTTQTFSTGTGSGFAIGASPQQFSFDPVITSTVGYQYNVSPVNNALTSGTGLVTPGSSSSIFGLRSHTATANIGLAESFWTGTSAQIGLDNTRGSSNSPQNLFNPYVQSTAFISVTQNLLNGFGILPNTRNIRIAKNNKKIADLQFELQAITTVTSTITAYWELVYDRENVKVEQQAATVSEKLFNDNKKQLEIGTMAPLDVTRAESNLASDRQNLILAQTTQLQQEQILKATISKNPLDPRFVNVEIIPTDSPSRPEAIESATFEQSIQEAFTKRPDLREQDINIDTQNINVKVTRNGLLPIATLTGTYGSSGLAGNQVTAGTTSTSAGSPIVDVNGVPIPGLFLPNTTTTNGPIKSSGFGDTISGIFHNNFPDYNVSVNLQIPLRNRQAQADNQAAMLQQRQAQAQSQQTKNAALLDVRNTYIALQQDRARVDAAVKARELQQQTFEAEQKKYTLGASTVYLVIQTQRDFVTSQGTELRALIDLVEAKANFERAVGRTLDVNRVTVANGGSLEHDTLIPGTLHGKVIGTDDAAIAALPAGPTK